MATLPPTPARLALLDAVHSDQVHRVQKGLHGGGTREWDSNNITGRRVTTTLADMEAAGWVTLPAEPPANRLTRRWQLTDAGQAVLGV